VKFVTYCNKPKCIPVNNTDDQLAATITNVENNFRTASCEKLVSVSEGDISVKSLLEGDISRKSLLEGDISEKSLLEGDISEKSLLEGDISEKSLL
jgi:hypothetical protein